jgi:hypothetical protein
LDVIYVHLAHLKHITIVQSMGKKRKCNLQMFLMDCCYPDDYNNGKFSLAPTHRHKQTRRKTDHKALHAHTIINISQEPWGLPTAYDFSPLHSTLGILCAEKHGV